ncbi:MAG TPA: hypothetical protein VGK49_04500 [Ilumatobacteraceae bacterium]
MATPRPKQFVAARDFMYARRSYRRGDPLTDRWTIAQLARHGDKFLRSVKPAPAESSADPSAVTPEAESPKEDR